MKSKLSVFFVMLAAIIVAMISYTFLHELGHGLVVIASGGQITRLSISLARTWHVDAGTSPLAMSLNNIAGMLLPVLFSFVSLLFYNKHNKSLIYQFCYGSFFAISTASVFTWFFLPIMSFFIQISPADDVSKFLVSSKMHPLFVSFSGIIIIALLISFALAKKLPQGFFFSIKTAIEAKENESVLGRKTLVILSAVVILFISFTAMLEIPYLSSKPIFDLTISDVVTSTDYERKFSFWAEESRSYEFDLELTESGYLTDIRILDNAQNVVYQNIAESISAKGSLALSVGEYTIYVTHLYDMKAFEEYCDTMNYTFNGDAGVLNNLKSVYENDKQKPSLSLSIK